LFEIVCFEKKLIWNWLYYCKIVSRLIRKIISLEQKKRIKWSFFLKIVFDRNWQDKSYECFKKLKIKKKRRLIRLIA
jgi:hypothetical protein